MYDLKDISVIIPTYNRVQDLKKTLDSFYPEIKNLNEVVIVDQSKDNLTKKLINDKKNKNLRYIFLDTPSIPIARNTGIENCSKNSKIIIFIDDDVNLGKNYFCEILKIFNLNPEARAVAAYVPENSKKSQPRVDKLLRKIFFISYLEHDKCKMTSAYGNVYPLSLSETINAEWLPGVNMAYKKEVFKEQKFDENLLGYTVVEDIDFTFRLFKKYPKSLYITPFAKIKHRVSQIERYPTKKMSFVNQIDHFYFYYKNLDTGIISNIKFIWSIIGITLLRILKAIVSRRKMDLLKLKFYFISLVYCLKNRGKIKKGILRDF